MMENKKAYDKANLEGAINSFLTDRRWVVTKIKEVDFGSTCSTTFEAKLLTLISVNTLG
jgi:hypothetical protein